ncbi:hypothetical protein CLOM_g23077 [Closterium sp. NIES-68]|nr:hypothetical protein CLOM_g23077 [Closterium sp. NIES-68]GJP61517.1 hypothetical protein CLOP_g18670 [Closterium sp. NIES-67]
MQSGNGDQTLSLSLVPSPPTSHATITEQQKDRACRLETVDFFRPCSDPSSSKPCASTVPESAPAVPQTTAANPQYCHGDQSHHSAEPARAGSCADYSIVFSSTIQSRVLSPQKQQPSAGRSSLLTSSIAASVAEWSNAMMPPPGTAGLSKSPLPGSSLTSNDPHRHTVTAVRRPSGNPISHQRSLFAEKQGDPAEADDRSAKRPRCESLSHQLPSLSSSTACTGNIRDRNPTVTRPGRSNPPPPVPTKFSSANIAKDIQKSARGDLSLDLPPPCCSWMCIYFSVPCRQKNRLAATASGRTTSVSAVSGSVMSGGDSGVNNRRRVRPAALPASSGTSLSVAAAAPQNLPRKPAARAGSVKEEREEWVRDDQSKAGGGAHLARCDAANESANGGDSSVHGGLNSTLKSALAVARGGLSADAPAATGAASAATGGGVFASAGAASKPAGASASELLASYAASSSASPALRAFLALSPDLSSLLNPSFPPPPSVKATDAASALLRRLHSDSAAAAVAAATAARLQLLQQLSAAQQQQQQQQQNPQHQQQHQQELHQQQQQQRQWSMEPVTELLTRSQRDNSCHPQTQQEMRQSSAAHHNVSMDSMNHGSIVVTQNHSVGVPMAATAFAAALSPVPEPIRQSSTQEERWCVPAPLTHGCGHSSPPVARNNSKDRVSSFIAPDEGQNSRKNKALDLSLRL